MKKRSFYVYVRYWSKKSTNFRYHFGAFFLLAMAGFLFYHTQWFAGILALIWAGVQIRTIAGREGKMLEWKQINVYKNFKQS